jgi:hypothetical protein
VIAQRHQFTNTQGFRSIVIALLAVVALAGAAFFFGTGLRADTAQSVAPSPLGSSLTNVRGSQSVDYVGRLINSSAAARSVAPSPLGSSLTNVRGSQSVDYVGRLINSSAAARSVAASPLGSSLTNVRGSQSVARSPLGSSLTAVRQSRFEDRYDRMNTSSAAVTSASSADRWAGFYAGLDKALKDAGARP